MEDNAMAEEALALQGQADIWKFMFSFVDSMALKAAVELRIPDIIHLHGGPIPLTHIVSGNSDASSPDINCLARIMRLLVRRKIFTAHHPSDGGETLYGLTHSSRWLLRDSETSLALTVLMQNHQWLLAPWHCLSQRVREGGPAFEKAHGRGVWEFASENPEFNKLFNDGIASTTKILSRAVLSGHKYGFESIETMVDVGGGTGGTLAEIVKSYPHIKGINFDLLHVVTTAPEYEGVTHVRGDMFHSIPNADAVFMQMVMHNWSDENCIKILKNCKKATPETTGKVIIVDIVLKPDGNGIFDDTGLIADLLMAAHTSGGRERTELEWKKILEEAGFPRYKIITIQDFPSIIEAYPI